MPSCWAAWHQVAWIWSCFIDFDTVATMRLLIRSCLPCRPTDTNTSHDRSRVPLISAHCCSWWVKQETRISEADSTTHCGHASFQSYVCVCAIGKWIRQASSIQYSDVTAAYRNAQLSLMIGALVLSLKHLSVIRLMLTSNDDILQRLINATDNCDIVSTDGWYRPAFIAITTQ